MLEWEKISDVNATTTMKVLTGRFERGLRMGDVRRASEELRSARDLLPHITDPMTKTAALQLSAYSCVLGARYREALDFAQHELLESERLKLEFVVPHALFNCALAEMGLRMFDAARVHFSEVELLAERYDLRPLLSYVRAALARLVLMTTPRIDEIAHLAEGLDESAPAPAQAEHLASIALGLAACGKSADATNLTTQARKMSGVIEVRVLTQCVEVIQELRKGVARHDRALEAFRVAEQAGNYDSFVCSYRAYPPLVETLANESSIRQPLTKILRQAGDHALARAAGIRIATDRRKPSLDPRLSPREEEVLDLLVAGCTNKEIAQTLFISESTAKVHVRHIIEKLGVRSRTEAAILALRLRVQATPDSRAVTTSE